MTISATIAGLLVLLLALHALAIGVLMALNRGSPSQSRAKTVKAIVLSWFLVSMLFVGFKIAEIERLWFW